MSENRAGEETDRVEGDKPPTLPEVVWSAARWLARRELLIRLAMVGVLVGIGVGAAFAFAGELEKHEAKLVAPLQQVDASISARVTKIEEREAERDRLQLEQSRLMSETNLNVRLFLELHKIKPIDVPRFAADAGQ